MSWLLPALFLDNHDGIVQMDCPDIGLGRGRYRAVVIPSMHVINHLLDVSDSGGLTPVAASIRFGPIGRMQVLYDVKRAGLEQRKQGIKALALMAPDVGAII